MLILHTQKEKLLCWIWVARGFKWLLSSIFFHYLKRGVEFHYRGTGLTSHSWRQTHGSQKTECSVQSACPTHWLSYHTPDNKHMQTQGKQECYCLYFEIHIFKMSLAQGQLSSHPRDKSVSSLRWGEVQRQDISCVAMEALQQLPALHIPQCTCAIPTAGQDLPQTYIYTAKYMENPWQNKKKTLTLKKVDNLL